MLATNAEVQDIVSELGVLTARLVELLLVDDTTVGLDDDGSLSSSLTGGWTSVEEEQANNNNENLDNEDLSVNSSSHVPKSGDHEDGAHIQLGDMVVVTRKDRYQGQRGIVVRKRGTRFWDIKLEAKGRQQAQIIYKAASSLKVVSKSK